jgi:hypothetical protein
VKLLWKTKLMQCIWSRTVSGSLNIGRINSPSSEVDDHTPILFIMLRALGLLTPKDINLFYIQIFLYCTTWWRLLYVPDEGYSRNVQCTLNYIPTFLLTFVELYIYIIQRKYKNVLLFIKMCILLYTNTIVYQHEYFIVY